MTACCRWPRAGRGDAADLARPGPTAGGRRAAWRSSGTGRRSRRSGTPAAPNASSTRRPAVGQRPQVGHAGGERAAELLDRRAAGVVRTRCASTTTRPQPVVRRGPARERRPAPERSCARPGARPAARAGRARASRRGARSVRPVDQVEERLGGRPVPPCSVTGARSSRTSASTSPSDVDRDRALAEHQPQRGDAVLQVGGDRLPGDGDVGVRRAAAGRPSRPAPRAPGRRRRGAPRTNGGEPGHAGRGRQVAGVLGGVERGDASRRWRPCARSASSTGSGRSSRPALRSTPATSSRHCSRRGRRGTRPASARLVGHLVLGRHVRVGRRAGRCSLLVGGTHRRVPASRRRIVAVKCPRARGRPVRAGAASAARACSAVRASSRTPTPIARSSTSKVPRCRSSGAPPPCGAEPGQRDRQHLGEPAEVLTAHALRGERRRRRAHGLQRGGAQQRDRRAGR